MATRSFDTNTEKEGFERKETYHYNNLNQLIRTDIDNLGQGNDIDAYILRDKDLYGRDMNVKSYANNVLSSNISYEYDTYNRQIKRINLGVNEQKERIIETKYDAYNREIEIFTDTNANGLFDGNEGKLIFHRDTDANGTILGRTDVYSDGRSYTAKWFYDDFGRRIATHQDLNDNGIIDGEEPNWKISFIGQPGQFDELNEYRGTTLTASRKVIYDDGNAALASFRSGADKVYTLLNYDGYDKPRSSKEDFTTSHYDELFNKYGGNLKVINMTNTQYSTDITLDNNVLAKLTKSELVVNGDATDTIRLKDNTEFTQLDN
ncbi:hypothetical protein ACERCG_12160, partial [Mannheimia sp. E30BD]